MATIWERIQAAAKAAMDVWRGGGAEYGGGNLDRLYFDGLSADQRERVELYKLAWSYYHGEQKRQLKSKPGNPDDNVIINHSRRIVDDGVSFLFGKPLTWELTEGQTTPEEEAIESVWRSPEWKMAFLHDVALNGAVCGTFHIQIVPPEPDKGYPLPRLVNLYPGMVFPEWNPENIDEVWAYQLRYRSGDTIQRKIFSLDDRGQWQIWEEKLTRGNTWEQTMPPEVWPWPWSPIVSGKNLPNPNNFYGESDLADADMNDYINLVASNSNRIIRLYAHKPIWGYGFGQDDLDVSPGKAIMAKSDKAALNTLDAAGDMGNSVTHQRGLTQDFYQTTRVPEMNPENMALGAQSGFALQVLFGPLLSKTATKQNLYGMALVELNRRIAEMLELGADNQVKLHWGDPLPVDIRARTEWLKFLREQGVLSKEGLAARADIDWETERERVAADKAADTNLGSQLLSAFERGAGQ